MSASGKAVIGETPDRKARRFWKVFIASCAWILAVVALMNLLVDPFDIYGVDIFPPVMANRYQIKVDLFRRYNPPARALILGSSRVGMIDPDQVTAITGLRCFSWGLPIARAENFYSIIRIATEEERAPIELVIVGAEPEIFHPKAEPHEMIKSVPDYWTYTGGVSSFRDILRKVTRLFSVEQTLASIRVLGSVLRGEKGGDWIEWGDDGFPIRIDRERRPALIEEDAETRIERGVLTYPDERFGISTFTGLSELRKQYWEVFLAICEMRGIDVYVFMPPPHPDLLDRLYELGAGPIFEETVEYLDRTVSEVGGTFRDYTRLESFGGDPEMFSDEVHLRKPLAEQILADLLLGSTRETGETPER